MPEGPEVENVRLGLLLLKGKKLITASLTNLALKYNRYQEQMEKISSLNNQILQDIERKGKYLIWKFENHIALNHLGMTGKWILPDFDVNNKFIVSKSKNRHPKVILTFENNFQAIFDDVRNFGRFQIYESEENMLQDNKPLLKLGIDGLAKLFPQQEFKKLLKLKRNQNKPLGEILLDSRFVPEIGNIYKSEILFHTHLHPYTLVEQLNSKEIDCLGQSTSLILQKALKSGGSTIKNFESPAGKGEAQNWHQVYAKEGIPCLVCNTPIKKIVQKQRSTFFCPKCQSPRVTLKIRVTNKKTTVSSM